MNNAIAEPVSGIINAFHRGTIKAQRICKAAQRAAGPNVEDTVVPAQSLGTALAEYEASLRYAYDQHVKDVGNRYVRAFQIDHVTISKLRGLTINVTEQLDNLDDYQDNPDNFDLGSFRYIQKQSEKYRDQALACLQYLNQTIQQISPAQGHTVPVRDDRTSLPSARRIQHPPSPPISDVSPRSEIAPEGLGIGIPKSSPTITSPTPASPPKQYVPINRRKIPGSFADELEEMPLSPVKPPDGGMNLPIPEATPPSRELVPDPLQIPETKVKRNDDSVQPSLIMKEVVEQQISAIDAFLAKRRLSRDLFQQELHRISMASASTSEYTSSHNSYVSPLPYPVNGIRSEGPQQSRPNSYQLTAIDENVAPDAPPTPARGGMRVPLPNRHESWRVSACSPTTENRESVPLMYDVTISPVSPDPQNHGSSGGGFRRESNGPARSPEYFGNVVEGLEVVNPPTISDPGIMLVAEDTRPQGYAISLTPDPSFKSVDHTLQHDSSFFKYGGFCDGAKATTRGALGTMKEIQRPGGMYTDLLKMRCMSCSFEAEYNAYHKDIRLEKSGIMTMPKIDDIRYRSRFLIKSHLKSKLADDSFYACIFCVEDNKTIESWDATVFFSSDQLFRHLQRHPRPLRPVNGVKVVYGPQPESTVDFDLHFISMMPKGDAYVDVVERLSQEASAMATGDHHPNAKGFKAFDPDHRPTLRFAVGARIVGITFPKRHSGTWCTGYHDGEKGSFPSSVIQLCKPLNEDVSMNPNSTLSTVAKWDFQPKDQDSGWLSFKKKERITHVGYPYRDFWCWSGMNAKGKWGLFPRGFADGLVDEGNTGHGFDEVSSGPTNIPPKAKKLFGIGGGSPARSPEGSWPTSPSPSGMMPPMHRQSTGGSGTSRLSPPVGKARTNSFMGVFKRNTVKSQSPSRPSHDRMPSVGSVSSGHRGHGRSPSQGSGRGSFTSEAERRAKDEIYVSNVDINLL